MLSYEYKLDGAKQQYAAIDEAMRSVQFIRNKCLRLWMDTRGISKNDLQRYCAVLAKDSPFASRLNSQARQISASRAWFAVARFYDNCKHHKPGKKGYPKFQHDNRSVEYKHTGWKLEADGKHITFTDGCGIGRLRLVGNPGQKIEAFPLSQIKRVRIVRRADGYYGQFAVQATRQIDSRCRLGELSQVGEVLRGAACYPGHRHRAALDFPGLLCVSYTGQEVPLHTNAHLSDVWVGAGQGRECRTKHPGKSLGRYPGAQGNL
jgi:hypothetical protein